MLKALAKLTKSDAIPASKDQMLELKNETQERERRIHEFKKTDDILKNLKQSYAEHKCDAAPKRYKALREMTEKAISDLRRNGTEGGTIVAKGKIGSLLKTSEAFGTSTDTAKQSDALGSLEAEAKLKILREETELYKKNYRQRRDILEELDKKYKDALTLNPINRYAQVKNAVKSSIESYEALAF